MELIIRELANRGIKADEQTVLKNGIEKRGIRVGNGNICPVVYEDMWSDMDDVNDIADYIMDVIAKSEIKTNPDEWFTHDYVSKNVKLRIRAASDKATKDCLDCVLEAYIPVPNVDGGSVVIQKEHLSTLGYTEKGLLQRAKANTKGDFNAIGMSVVMATQLGMSSEELAMMGMPISETLAEEQMIVCSNEEKINGATALAYPEFFKGIAEKIGRDRFYILPSSIHELLVVNSDAMGIDELRAMVQEVNDTQVLPEERLSYSVYEYHNGKVKVA